MGALRVGEPRGKRENHVGTLAGAPTLHGIIVGEARSYVILHSDPTAHAELLAVRDAAMRLGTRDLSSCDIYSTATPCPMCQGALYWGRIRRVFTQGGAEAGSVPKLGC